MIALLAAVILGVPVGIAMGLNDTVRGVLDPLIELYRPVPPLAYLPLMVIWFGIGETSKILLIYLAILPRWRYQHWPVCAVFPGAGSRGAGVGCQ